MRINCGPSGAAKRSAKRKWHDWFAWYPVRLSENDCRWLETIQRKGQRLDVCVWLWEYRKKGDEDR